MRGRRPLVSRQLGVGRTPLDRVSPPRRACRARSIPTVIGGGAGRPGDRTASRRGRRPPPSSVRSCRDRPPSSGCRPGSRWSPGWPMPTPASSARGCSSPATRSTPAGRQRWVRRLHRPPDRRSRGVFGARRPDRRAMVPRRGDERDGQGARLAGATTSSARPSRPTSCWPRHWRLSPAPTASSSCPTWPVSGRRSGIRPRAGRLRRPDPPPRRAHLDAGGPRGGRPRRSATWPPRSSPRGAGRRASGLGRAGPGA